MEISERSSSPDHSCVSLKSDRSLQGLPPNLSNGPVTSDPRVSRRKRKRKRSSSPDHSCVSLKSDASMPSLPPNLNNGPVTSDLSAEPVTSDPRVSRRKRKRSSSPDHSCVSLKSDWSMINNPHPKLSADPVTSDPSCVYRDDQIRAQDPPQAVNDELQRVKEQHKTSMKNKYERLFEGLKLQENESLLNSIYTQLYIIEGEREGVNEEHEVLQMEKTARTQPSQDTPIYCNDIFKASAEAGCEEKEQIKTVLTKGIAGIGKTVSVQKFILDWAEGKANQDVDFMFVLPFRELNLIRDHPYSLHRLLLDFHPELQDLDSQIYEECKVVFIFDGLDESRITLMFSDAQKVCDVTETSSVAVLMSKLMKGELLPSALIWITSRPAAANQIPSKYIHRLTEIQGFTEPQKEEYFRKRISDEHQASRIISHIRRARSLHIMCHIPVFCWISSTVLQKLLEEDLSAEIPQTLTEMYIHFLLIQINMRKQKYEERDPEKLLPSNREVIVKLAEVAFKQLMKGNVMFYEEDLIESSIDVTDASVYSGICTEIFKQESVIHQRKVYSFIHLSVQEFLAAFYLLYCYLTKNKKTLREFRSYGDDSDEDSLYDLLTSAVDKSLESKNGRLDLFLRFLLGVSLESNQRLLQDLLTHTENSSETIRETTQYIKEKIKDEDDDDDDLLMVKRSNPLSADQSINLFLCLLEVKDQTLFREIQEFVKSDKHSEKLSAAHCSTISYMLQMSEETLDELNPMKYNTSAEGRRRLIPAVINCRKALFSGCGLSEQHCEIVSSALQSSNCVLRELDLRNNDLQDSGVKFISDGLKSPNCQLQILSLAGCNLTAQCCESLSSALKSSNCVLRELDLRNNDLQDSGVKFISDGLKSPNCQLQILSLAGCNLTAQCCERLSSALQSSNCVLRELDLRNNDLQDSGVKFISDGLKSPNCQLQTLRLSGCMVTEEGCGYLSSALSSNPSHLRELDLSYNHPGESGVKLLKHKLQDPNYKLQILNVDHGGEKMMRAGLRKYACDLTLDPNTAHTRLVLSDENKKITRVEDRQLFPDHPERFDRVHQVLSVESLTGRCYWETEWSGRAAISVSYKGINKKGGQIDCWYGSNDKSWSLYCSDNRFSFWHNNNETVIPAVCSSCKRVGVYVDVSDGSLSFYSVSDTLTHLHTHTLTHLHTHNTTFTDPLYAGFGVNYYSSVSLCDIKEPPVRIISDAQAARSSVLRYQPLLKCQSCVHISDPDQWDQIEPSLCTDEGVSKFRVSTGPGRYECVRTRMRWVCDGDVTLQYHTVDGRFLNTELERLQCNRIAPVMDVTVISGKLEEVHLPHYICLGESGDALRDAVNVLSVKDEGITTEPVELTRFHAKIVQPSFSLKTLIIRWILRWDEHCNLLLYMHSKDPLTLHVYFFPADYRAKEEVEKIEKSSYLISHPRPDRAFRMKTPHSLDVPGASVHPREGITFRRQTDPNFFKIMIKTRLENNLQMSLTREEDKKIVWTATLEKEEFDQNHPKRDKTQIDETRSQRDETQRDETRPQREETYPQRDETRLKSEADKARYFDDHWSVLIQRVTNVQIIADKLRQQQLIHEEQYSEIIQSLTRQDGMRKICEIIRKHGDAVKAKLISVLQEEKLFHF
ncbi:NACHT, LRR and PYD domains-containing protein 12-like isoform X6 [Carassius gibelio]|uniref:NACHT, LRR and PYD domains-containing protein 12-like isoform X6 n=1 Tax=Carassius gibelio TaxID=101364 RepID=UPI0022792EAD|nr:NACHT, LRR and PYD domains-containing protein 12-like isoform X6 [Carassius gibelio]